MCGRGEFEPASCCLKMLSRANRRQRGETAGRGALHWGHLTTVAPAERETNQATSRRQQPGFIPAFHWLSVNGASSSPREMELVKIFISHALLFYRGGAVPD